MSDERDMREKEGPWDSVTFQAEVTVSLKGLTADRQEKVIEALQSWADTDGLFAQHYNGAIDRRYTVRFDPDGEIVPQE